MVLLDPVSEGQLNERLMNAAGLDEPITRRRSVFFFEQESQPYLIFTMIRTPSYYGRAREDLSYHIDDNGNGNQKQKHDWGLRGPR